jgi:hypothetical protein
MWLAGFVFLILSIRGAGVFLAWGRLAEGPRTHQGQTPVRDDQSKLVVVRAGGFYKDRLVRYRILVDGSVAGSLYEYDTLVVPVEPGHHCVQARIQVFFGSREMVVEVDRHESKHFVVAAGPGRRVFAWSGLHPAVGRRTAGGRTAGFRADDITQNSLCCASREGNPCRRVARDSPIGPLT